MLISLFIENFAIVERLELDLSSGLTVFTGETGAGKSIMLDAMLLILGGRADAQIVRPGATKACLNACFTISKDDQTILNWLQEQDITYDLQEPLILKRVITNEGRSKASVNGIPVSLQKLKELGDALVHIHGQHEHHHLSQSTTQRKLLDNYGKYESALQQVANDYDAWHSLQDELRRLEALASSHEKRALLDFQIGELEGQDLRSNEFVELEQEHQQLHHAKEYLDTTQQALLSLRDAEDESIIQRLHKTQQLLQGLPAKSSGIISAIELLENAIIHCQECSDELEHFTDKIEISPERLFAVEQRLSTLHQLARKYHCSPDSLPELLAQLKIEYAGLNHREERINELRGAIEQALERYHAAAKTLTNLRQQAAQQLSTEITHIIKELGMPKGFLEIQFNVQEQPQRYGQDKIEFMVCTNPGSPLYPLAKIASGGELSRISLAIQMITAQRGITPTLMFDEVDVGIGGATAALVGSLLRKLGERLQVFCVTHQAQVAASAHHHYRVEKFSDDKATFSRVSRLDVEQKTQEIARMLGGLTITDNTLQHARELLHQAQ